MTKETSRWVRKAEADLRMARALVGKRPPLYDGICFHCQQSAEKYLKALLQESGAHVPRTHDDADATARQARTARKWAEHVRTEIRNRLKLRP